MAAPRKYGDDIRQAIHELINERGLSSTEAARHLASQYPDAPHVDRIRGIAREEKHARRPPIDNKPKTEQLHTLISGLVRLYDNEIGRLEHQHGPLDADTALKIAQGIKTIEPLLTEKPAGKGQQETPATLGMLTNNNNTNAA